MLNLKIGQGMEVDLKRITGLAIDSREVKPGFIFIAISGSINDGHKYISQAIANGAKIIIHQNEISKSEGVKYIKVDDSRIALADLVIKLYPDQPNNIIGVTGTNGKSSTVHFIREILKFLGKKAVSIGTLGVLGDLQVNSKLTTPSLIEIHKILQQVANNNIHYAAIECSSHGIQQHRLDKVNFKACAFTNFSQDHLDYHHTMDEYFQAKLSLFSLMKKGYAVLNADIPEFKKLSEYCLKHSHKIITYGKKDSCDIIIKKIEISGIGQSVLWSIEGKEYKSKVNLVGEFQIYNIACAIALLKIFQIDFLDIIKVLPKLSTVTGRMELVATHNNANIFVDYAHTPDALKHSLEHLRLITKNNLWLIFGCGGDRDKEKRSIMGKIASENANKIIVTDDNPRYEDPKIIRSEIISTCKNAIEISDRSDAISYALSCLQPGDNLIIAGKGHENYQIIGDKVFEFSDSKKVLKILSDM